MGNPCPVRLTLGNPNRLWGRGNHDHISFRKNETKSLSANVTPSPETWFLMRSHQVPIGSVPATPAGCNNMEIVPPIA